MKRVAVLVSIESIYVHQIYVMQYTHKQHVPTHNPLVRMGTSAYSILYCMNGGMVLVCSSDDRSIN